jgi:co-chaperonin GroES (HSP10)
MSVSDDAFATLSPEDLARFKPMNGYVLILRDDRPQTHGRIFLPTKGMNANRYEVTTGVVVRTGGLKLAEKPVSESYGRRTTSKGTRIALTVREGDRVAINRFAGHDIRCAGQNYLIATEDDILAVIGDAELRAA